MGGGHETRRLFIPGEDEANGRVAERVAQIEIFLTGRAEGMAYLPRFRRPLRKYPKH